MSGRDSSDFTDFVRSKGVFLGTYCGPCENKTAEQGATGPTGADGLPGAPGARGSTGATGATGVSGVTGLNGINGNTILNGTVPPTNSIGVVGDFYLDTAASVLYGPKISPYTTSGTTGAILYNSIYISSATIPSGLLSINTDFPANKETVTLYLNLGLGSASVNLQFYAYDTTGSSSVAFYVNGIQRDFDTTYALSYSQTYILSYMCLPGQTLSQLRFMDPSPANGGVVWSANQWSSSSTSLKGATGATGETGATGATGATGLSGATGVKGNTILNGSGVPSNSVGVAGDFYLNTTTNVLYGPKTTATRPATGSYTASGSFGNSMTHLIFINVESAYFVLNLDYPIQSAPTFNLYFYPYGQDIFVRMYGYDTNGQTANVFMQFSLDGLTFSPVNQGDIITIPAYHSGDPIIQYTFSNGSTPGRLIFENPTNVNENLIWTSSDTLSLWSVSVSLIGATGATGVIDTANITSSLIPSQGSVVDLGSTTSSWNNLFVNTLNSSSGGASILANTSLIPSSNASFDLGSAILSWNNIYSVNAPSTTSDERNKSNIAPSDLGLTFIEKLKPVKYNFIGGNRTHYGLTTQQVKRTLEDLSCYDFAGFVLADKDDPDSAQMLRYEEFISPIIQSIQDLNEIVNRQQKQIEDLMMSRV